MTEVGCAVDMETVGELRDSVGGDPEFLAELIDAFLADAPTQLESLRESATSGEADGANGVQEAGALFERLVARVLLRGVLKNRFHRIRRQPRVRLKHQGHRSAHDGRGHARAAEAQVRQVIPTDRAR